MGRRKGYERIEQGTPPATGAPRPFLMTAAEVRLRRSRCSPRGCLLLSRAVVTLTPRPIPAVTSGILMEASPRVGTISGRLGVQLLRPPWRVGVGLTGRGF